jgi:hypothetical protein
VLKKAGIVVAASVAGILAFSPLAFAGEGHDGDKHYGKKDDKGHSHVEEGDVTTDNLSNDCQFGNEGGSPTAGAIGGSSLLGAVAAVASLATDATSQLNTLNCNNIEVSDVLDFDSNNETTTVDKTEVDDSFNIED